jgi:hypothetical protein
VNKTDYLKQLELLSSKLEPFNPNLCDMDYKVLQEQFDVVYDSGILQITHLPKDIQDEYKLLLFTTLTKYSGALAFLVIQILAANNIMSKHNYAKQEYYLKKKCGIAINHLRVNKTIVSAKKIEDGYLLNGTLTWASGYKIFDILLIGFHHGENEYEAMAPFQLQDGFTLGVAPQTFVGNGLNTINIDLKDFFIKEEDIVSSNPLGNYTKQKSASKTVHFCLYGTACASLDKIIDEELFINAKEKLETIKSKFLASTNTNELDILRVELFQLAQNIITTAMTLQGGISILSNDDFQRHYRELIMFNSNGLNSTLKEIFKEKFLKMV